MTNGTKKQTLQKWIDNEAILIAKRLDEAIAEGASIRMPFAGALCIDDIYLNLDLSGKVCLNMKIPSERIAKIFEPDEDELLAQRDALQIKINEINTKLQTLKDDETNND